MKSTGAPERAKSKLARIDPAFDAHFADRLRHFFDGDANDPTRCGLTIRPDFRRDAIEGCFGTTNVDRELATQLDLPRYSPKNYVGVGDRR